MADKSWKKHERKVAKLFGVKRGVHSGNLGEGGCDTTEHPVFSIECKYISNLPAYLLNGLAQARRYGPLKTPILVIKPKGKPTELVVMHIKDFIAHMGDLCVPQEPLETK